MQQTQWQIERTESFFDALKLHKKNTELLHALQAKIDRLQVDPYTVGGRLSGVLSNLHSARLVKKFRLLFEIEDQTKKVLLITIDHRKDVYS